MRVSVSVTTSQSGDQSDGQSEWKQRLQRLYGSGSFWLLLGPSGSFWVLLGPSGSFWVLLAPSGSFWLHVLRAKWMERNADVWERSNNATRVCGADRAVELVESVKLVEHTTWSGHVQYVVVRVLHGL